MTTGSRFVRCISIKMDFGGGFGARVVIPPRNRLIEGGLLRDRTCVCAGIIRSDSSGIDQPLYSRLKARLGDQPRRFDVVSEIIIPGLRMSARQMEYKINSIHEAS